MPQKKNPDVAELVRGKTGRLYGNLQAVLVTMKGLPLTYNSDMQEDKEPLFDTVDTLEAVLRVVPPMLATLRFHVDRMREMAGAQYSTATDLADYLVRKGLPFRLAHEVVGKAVRYGLAHGLELADVPLAELQRLSPLIEADVFHGHHRGGLTPRARRHRRNGARRSAPADRAGPGAHRAGQCPVRSRARLLLALGLLGLTLASCGKRGPPVAPERRLPAAPAALEAFIDENAILVTWSNPTGRMDGSRLRDLVQVKLYRREEVDGGPMKPAMLSGGRIVGYDEIAAISLGAPAPATVDGDSVKWIDDDALVSGRRYVYVVTAIDSLGRSSAPSERRSITFLSAPKPPTGVEATAASRQVTLHWTAPTEFADGTPVAGDVRYIVLRGVGAEGPLAILTAQPIAGTSYTDAGLTNDTEYRYSVRSVRIDPRAVAGGVASEIVRATPIETARPAPPRNLVAVPTPDAVRLAWSASPGAERGALRHLSGHRRRRVHPGRQRAGHQHDLRRPRRAARHHLPLRGHGSSTTPARPTRASAPTRCPSRFHECRRGPRASSVPA